MQAASTHPVREMAVIGAVLAHGRNHKSVAEFDPPDGQGMEDGGCFGRLVKVKVKGCAGGGELGRGVEGDALGGFACSRLV